MLNSNAVFMARIPPLTTVIGHHTGMYYLCQLGKRKHANWKEVKRYLQLTIAYIEKSHLVYPPKKCRILQLINVKVVDKASMEIPIVFLYASILYTV